MERFGNIIKYTLITAVTIAALAMCGAAAFGVLTAIKGGGMIGSIAIPALGGSAKLGAYFSAAALGIKGLASIPFFGLSLFGKGLGGISAAAIAGGSLGAVRGALTPSEQEIPYPARETAPEFSPPVQARQRSREVTSDDMAKVNALMQASPSEKQAYLAARGSQPSGPPLQPNIPT